MEKKRFFNKFKLFIIILIILIGVIIGSYQLITFTNTRYIKKEKDEIRGYYTSLYFQGTGEGNCIVLENNVGYTTFQLMNYIDEDVTKRDIEYNIRTIDEFYTQSGSTDLYVKDVWDRLLPVKPDTNKYSIEVVSNNSETGHGNPKGGDYMFSYQEVDDKGIGKTHSVTLKVKRNADKDIENGVENISIVIELVKPYSDVYIINMVVVDRLIAFTSGNSSQFGVEYQRLNIQTADSFTKSFTKESEVINITPKAFLVELRFKNLYIEKRDLSILHNVVDIEKINDAISEKNYSNIDITKPYIVSLDLSENGGLTLYIPQSSSINIDFFPTSDDYYISAIIKYYDGETYEIYDNDVGGYEGLTEKKPVYVLGSDNYSLVH